MGFFGDNLQALKRNKLDCENDSIMNLTSPKLWMVRGPRVMGNMGRPAESRVMGGHRRLGLLLLPLFLDRPFSEDDDPPGEGVELLLPDWLGG